MADQQDQLSSGGSVEKASASADTSKPRGKNSSSSSSNYRKRQNTGAISETVEEKRRRQIISDPQTSQVHNTAHAHSADSSREESRVRGERRNHGTGLESYPDTDWRPHHKIHQASYNNSGSSARVRSVARTNLSELNFTPTDCVASRTRSRTPQNPQALAQGSSSSYDLSLSSGYSSRKTSTYNSSLVASSSATSITSHPSTSRGRGG